MITSTGQKPVEVFLFRAILSDDFVSRSGYPMRKRGEKWVGYFDLLDTFEEPGCPLCNRIRKLSRNFLDSLYYERVTDVGTRVNLRKSKGFCNFHAWMSTEIRNSGSGIAIIYKDLLDSEINQLSK